jgi:uncharacterized membrane protein
MKIGTDWIGNIAYCWGCMYLNPSPIRIFIDYGAGVGVTALAVAVA